MRRKLKNLKNKGGHSDASPRQLIDEATYREHRGVVAGHRHFDSNYAGWSWATRPRDQAISLRRAFGPTGPS